VHPIVNLVWLNKKNFVSHYALFLSAYKTTSTSVKVYPQRVEN